MNWYENNILIMYHRRQSGVTLIETLVAFALFTAISVGGLSLLRESAYTRGMARDRAVMGLLAAGELDRIKALPAAELGAVETTGTLTANEKNFTVERTVTKKDNGLAELDVTVFRDTDRGKLSVRMATLREAAQ